MERKLASVRRVAELLPIDGADRIEVAVIDGWKLVTQKGNYNAGDLCVYFEVDSFLPVEPRFEFLRKACFKSTQNLGDGFRLRTIKLRGQISQGLSLPLAEFPEASGLEEGADLTELLKVKKYEKPIPSNLAGIARGNFPSFIRKTDQERAQNCLRDIANYAGEYEVTVKLDGSSMTVYKDLDGKIGVCSRNLDLVEDDSNLFWKTAKSSGAVKFLETFDGAVALQGELMGPGVQGNRENLEKHDFYIFDIWDIATRSYMGIGMRYAIIDKSPLLTVPPHYFGNLNNILSNTDAGLMDALLRSAEGPSLNPKVPREGLVFKAADGSFSFKVISNSYLLSED